MATLIYKYPIVDPGEMVIPGAKRVLSVQLQGDTPTVWAEVSTGVSTAVQVLSIVTGGEPPEGARYISTVVGIEGRLVYHFYAVGETEA